MGQKAGDVSCTGTAFLLTKFYGNVGNFTTGYVHTVCNAVVQDTTTMVV
jgi:hypothetical protein